MGLINLFDGCSLTVRYWETVEVGEGDFEVHVFPKPMGNKVSKGEYNEMQVTQVLLILLFSVSLPLKVQGMAVLRNRLYIAQYGSSSIALYNTETYARERSIQIAGLYNPYDLVASQDSDLRERRESEFDTPPPGARRIDDELAGGRMRCEAD